MNDLSLRMAESGDAPEIARLLRRTLATALPYLPVLHTPEEDVAFISGHVLPTCAVWIAETEQIAGFIAFRFGWIDNLYVDVPYHSRGIGSALLATAFDAHDRLQLWVFQRNAAALRFYQRKGFQLVETTDGSRNEEKEPDARLLWQREC